MLRWWCTPPPQTSPIGVPDTGVPTLDESPVELMVYIRSGSSFFPPVWTSNRLSVWNGHRQFVWPWYVLREFCWSVMHPGIIHRPVEWSWFGCSWLSLQKWRFSEQNWRLHFEQHWIGVAERVSRRATPSSVLSLIPQFRAPKQSMKVTIYLLFQLNDNLSN